MEFPGPPGVIQVVQAIIPGPVLHQLKSGPIVNASAIPTYSLMSLAGPMEIVTGMHTIFFVLRSQKQIFLQIAFY